MHLSCVWNNYCQVSIYPFGYLKDITICLVRISNRSERVASPCEATTLVLPLEVNLALLCRAFPAGEVRRASLLVLSSALPLALRKSLLALGAESDAGSMTLLTRTGALVLAP